MKRLFVLSFPLMLLSCSRQLVPQKSVQDSVVVVTNTKYVEKVRDSIVQIPADSSWLKALLACDSNGNVLIKQLQSQNGSRMQAPDLQLNGNSLLIKAKADSLQIHLLIKDIEQLIEEIKQHSSKEIITPPPERINYVTAWQKFFIKSGQLTWAVLITFLLGWLIKKRFKPF